MTVKRKGETMAHFYGSMTGARGERTCCGTKNSGIQAHIRGWNLGVIVSLEHDHETGKDRITVMQTGGSGGAHVKTKMVEFDGS